MSSDRHTLLLLCALVAEVTAITPQKGKTCPTIGCAGTSARGSEAVAVGFTTNASGLNAVAMGFSTTASGSNSHNPNPIMPDDLLCRGALPFHSI